MKRQVAVAISLLAFFLISGCATQPQKKPEPTPTPQATPAATPAPAAVPAPAAEQAEALELRKKCVDYGLNESMRDDFLKAETSYAAGAENYEKDNAVSASAYKEAIAQYRKILDAGLASITEDEKANAERMREVALSQGADSVSPDQMSAGDVSVSDAEGKAASKENEGAIADYRAAGLSFEIAYERTRAIDARDAIDTNEWSEYDPGNYELAGQQLAECDESFADDPADSLDSAQEALLRFNLVIKKGWEYALGESRSQSETEKEKADGIKSDVAAPDEYEEAEAAYEDAVALEASEQYEEANTAYEMAADMFAQTYETAKVKMDRATGALDALREKRDESQRLAEEGDDALGSATDGNGGKEGAQ